MHEEFNLGRFLEAQAGTYSQALSEIQQGRKRTHWMWFIFPQVAGLGRSATARFYAISSLAEAQAYLGHPLLGLRLHECVEALHNLEGFTAEEVFGQVDAAKLRSSLTLFVEAGGRRIVETELLRWFGESDPQTLAILVRNGGS